MIGCLALFIKKYIIYISNRNRIQRIHNSLVICGSQDEENNNSDIMVSPLPPNVAPPRKWRIFENYAISLLDYYEVIILFPILICIIGNFREMGNNGNGRPKLLILLTLYRYSLHRDLTWIKDVHTCLKCNLVNFEIP